MNKICILIHGYLTDYHDFTSLPKTLIKYYDQVILLNLPGHEHKKNLKNFTKNNVFNYLDKEFNNIFNSNKNNQIVDIIGFSLGGALAWHYSKKYPFHKVVLLSPAVHNLNFMLPVDKIKNHQRLKQLDRISYIKEKMMSKKREQDAVKFVCSNTLVKFNLHNGIEFLKIINVIKNNRDTSNIPTLLIRGELDELVKKDVIEIISKKLIGQKIIYEVPNIGHMMLRTDYEPDIIRCIINFLNNDI